MKNQRLGFTVVEIIVSAAIIVIALAGLFMLFASHLSSAGQNKNYIIAGNLAMEAIEMVRNFRDTQWINGTGYPPWYADGEYTVSWFDTSLTTVSSPEDTRLNKYGYGYMAHTFNPTVPSDAATESETVFSRKITITNSDQTIFVDLIGYRRYESIIEVEVTWNDAGIDRSLSLEEHLFNWN